jgi:hypothetical protein
MKPRGRRQTYRCIELRVIMDCRVKPGNDTE